MCMLLISTSFYIFYILLPLRLNIRYIFLSRLQYWLRVLASSIFGQFTFEFYQFQSNQLDNYHAY